VSAASENRRIDSEQHGDRGIGVLEAWWMGWVSALRMPGILLLKWLVNLAFAAAAVLPFALLLAEHLGHSAVGEQAFSRMGIDIAVEFAFANEARLLQAALACAPIALGYLVVNLYLTGGILQRLHARRAQPWGEFFAACNRHLPILLRVGILTLALGALVLWLPHLALSRLVDALTEDAASPRPLFYLTWLHWAILFLLGSWLARVYDYARIAVLLPSVANARIALGRGMAFALRRGTETFVLWILLVLPPLALTAFFATAPIANGVTTTLGIWLSAALGQALLLLRIAGSFAALGGQMRFMPGTAAP
jgi:hypothetical protein